MDLKYEIIEWARKAAPLADTEGFFREPLLGFSSAHNPFYEQLPKIIGGPHTHPEHALEGAETVVSLFLPFRKHVVTGNRGGAVASDEWARACVAGSSVIRSVCAATCAKLAERGISSLAMATTQSDWSHRSVACVSGLGRFGVNHMLITEKGCAGRFGSLIMTAQVEADAFVEEERCMHYKNGSCGVCMQNCPSKALGPDGFDSKACNAQLQRNKEHFAAYGPCDVCGKCSVGACAYRE